MSKEVILFPGQGLAPKDVISFYCRLNEIDPKNTNQRLFQAQEALNKIHGSSEFNVLHSLKDELSPDFQKTAFVQPIVYALSIAAHESLKSQLNPAYTAGHSLGEYAAITAAGVIKPEEGVEIVSYRGSFMQECSEKNPSRLISIMGLNAGQVAKICEGGLAETALINGPELIVVGCADSDVLKVEELAKSSGAKRTAVLQTSGAFHTSNMGEIAQRLSEVIDKYQFRQVQIPIVINLTGGIVDSGFFPKSNLIKSLTNSVQWAKSMQVLQDIGMDAFIEVGPGNSLQNLGRINGIPKEQMRGILSLSID